MLSVILIAVLTFAIIQNQKVQTWLAHKLASSLSKDLGTKVSINNINIWFFDRAQLEGLYIEDLHRDTLLYVEKADINLDDIFLGFRHFSFDRVYLQNGKFNVRQFKGEEDLNIQFLIDYVNGPRDSTKKVKKPPPELFFWKFDLDHIDFTYEYRDYAPDTIKYFNQDHIRIKDISASLKRFMIIDDSLSGELRNLSCHEKNGFIVKKMDADFIISYTMMDFSDLKITTPLSDLHGKLTMNYNTYDDLNDFISKVQMRGNIKKSFIHSRDLAFFAPELNGLDQVFSLSGNLKGTVDNLSCKNILLENGKESKFQGNFTINNLPEIDSSYFDIQINQFISSAIDIEKLPEYPFYLNKKMTLPEEIKRLGKFYFSGNLSGFLSDLNLSGLLKSDPGELNVKIHLRDDRKENLYTYQADLASSGINLGKIFQTKPLLGNLVFNGKINGKGLNTNTLNSEVTANIQSILFNDYSYKNINLSLSALHNKYILKLVSGDENFLVDLTGDFEMGSKQGHNKIQAKINNINFNAIHLIQRDETITLSTDLHADFTGDNPENLIGNAVLKNFNMVVGKKSYNLDNLTLNAGLSGEERSLQLRSSLADIQVRGIYKLNEFSSGLISACNNFLPAPYQINQSSKNISTQNYSLTLKLNDSRLLSALLFPELRFADGTHLGYRLSSAERSFQYDFSSPEIALQGLKIYGIKAQGKSLNEQIQTSLATPEILISDSLHIRNISLHAEAEKTAADFLINWSGGVKQADMNAFAKLKANFDDTRTMINILPSNIIIRDSLWQVNVENKIILEKSTVIFDNVALVHEEEFVRLNGKISPNNEDRFDILLDNFLLSNLNPFTSAQGVSFAGKTDGNISLFSLFNQPYFESSLDFKGIKINNDMLGDGRLNSKWIPAEKKINMDGALVTNNFPRFTFKGDYFPSRDDDNLDMNLKLSNFRINIIEPYLKDIFSRINDGIADGNIHLTGTPDKPLLDGSLMLKRVSFTVGLLNSTYSFTNQLMLTKNKIWAKNISITDQEGNTARLDLDISHRYFDDFYFDVSLKTDMLQVLNTTETQSDLFYGNANAMGTFHAYGPMDNIKMDISAKTAKGTKFYLPLFDAGEINEQDFISFEGISADNPKKADIKKRIRQSKGYELNFNLDITDEAEVFLIFDPNTGDIIKGKGTANLRLEINQAGDFNIFGNYNITSGNYLFNMVVSKPFMLLPGGSISFNGNPYDANIDLTAVYRVRTPLYNLVKNIDSSATVKRPIDVNATMHLKEKLMKPKISFDIVLPNADENSVNLLKSQIINEDELNRQVFALIMLGSFWPNRGGASEIVSVSGVGANASELISNQLNNLIGSFSEDFKLGLDYKQGNSINRDEVRLLLSTELLGDRLLIDGNFGTTGANQNNSSIQNTSNLVGEFTIEAKMNEKGTLRIKVFNRSNQYLLVYNGVPYTQGLGLFYRRDFDFLSDFKKSQKRKTEK